MFNQSNKQKEDIFQNKKIKTISPEYMNYLDEFKSHSNNKEKSFKIKILKKFGFFLKNIFDILKLIYFIIILGYFLKFIFPLEYKTFGKKSLITGIPFLRSYFFLIPVILEISLIILALAPYYNCRINEKYTMWKYLQKLNFLNVPSFIGKYLCFYFLYNNMIMSVSNGYGFKISGHVLITIFTSSQILNTRNLSDHLISQEIKRNNFNILSKIVNFVLYHNLYCLIVWYKYK